MNKKMKTLLLTSWLLFQSFSCLAIGWQLPATDLSAIDEDAGLPQVVVNDTGNAIAIWRRHDGSNWVVQTKKYDKATDAWSTVTNLSETGFDALYPQVAINNAGDAIAVWYRFFSGTKRNIQTKYYYKASDSWFAPATGIDISEAGKDALEPQVVIDGAGDAIAVWKIVSGFNFIIRTKYYVKSSNSWSIPATGIDLSSTGMSLHNPWVAINSDGNAIAIWRKSGGGGFVRTKNYDKASKSWSTPSTGIDLITGATNDPNVAMNSAGEAIAIWRKTISGKQVVQTKHYDKDSKSWPDSEKALSPTDLNAYDPQIAMNDAGDAFAAWRIGDSLQTKNYDKDTDSWLEPSTGTNIITGVSFYDPQVAMNNSGNAVAAWVNYDGPDEMIQTKNYSKATDAWSTVADFISATGQNAYDPRVVIDSGGNAIAAWCRTDDDTGKKVVQAAVFETQLPAPSNLTACKKIHRFPAQIDLIHALAWDAVENATKYRVYLDTDTRTFLAAKPAANTNPSTELHGRCPSTSYTYNVVAVDSDGDDGLPASITI